MNFNINDIDKAAEEAALSASIKTAEQREKALGKSFFSEIIEQLRATVDKETVDALEKEINHSTNKNETILRVIQKGGFVAKEILGLLSV